MKNKLNKNCWWSYFLIGVLTGQQSLMEFRIMNDSNPAENPISSVIFLSPTQISLTIPVETTIVYSLINDYAHCYLRGKLIIHNNYNQIEHLILCSMPL